MKRRWCPETLIPSPPPHPPQPGAHQGWEGSGRELTGTPRGSPQLWAGGLPLPLDRPHLHLWCRALRHGEGPGCAPSCGPKQKLSSHLATHTTRHHLHMSRVCP